MKLRDIKDWSIFPATKTVAFYATESNYIELSEVSTEELDRAVSHTDPYLSYKVLPLLLHEARHWFDHTSTLWGRKRLMSFFEALSVRDGNNEYMLHKIISYRNFIRKDVRDIYFSTVGDTSQTPTFENRWYSGSVPQV